MPLKQGSNASVTKFPFQQQDKPALGTPRLEHVVLDRVNDGNEQPVHPRVALFDSLAALASMSRNAKRRVRLRRCAILKSKSNMQGLWETLYGLYVPDGKDVLTSYVHYQPCGHPAPEVDSVLAALQACGGVSRWSLQSRSQEIQTKSR